MSNQNWDDVLGRAAASVQASEAHSLSRSFRVEMWTMMGERKVDSGRYSRPTLGQIRRFRLAKMCLEFVTPIWMRKFASDDRVARLLKCAEQLMAGQWGYEMACEEYATAWMNADNLAAELYDQNAHNSSEVFVAYAACKTLAVAIHDEEFGEEFDNDAQESDPYLLDAAEYACAAFAGGFVRDSNSRPDDRLSFWTWYLTTAIRASLI